MGLRLQEVEGTIHPEFISSESANPLNAQQMEILRWFATGLTNTEIGRKLTPPFAENTIKEHKRTIMNLLGVRTGGDKEERKKGVAIPLLIEALQRGILSPKEILPENYNDHGPRAPLSDQEYRVLQLLCTGKSRQEVAGGLDISERTLAVHESSIYYKLDVSNQVGAFGVFVNAMLGGIDLRRYSQEKFGKYEMPKNEVKKVGIQQTARRVGEVLQPGNEEYIMFPNNSEAYTKSLEILAKGGLLVLGYNSGNRRDVKLENAGHVEALLAFAGDRNQLENQVLFDAILRNIVRGLSSENEAVCNLQGQFWHLYVLQGSEKFTSDQAKVLEKFLQTLAERMQVPDAIKTQFGYSA